MKGHFVKALVAAMTLIGAAAFAEDTVTIQGRVTGPEGKGFAVGAQVTAYDDKDHVIGQATTDMSGIYKMSVPRSALHLTEHKKSGGGGNSLFKQVLKTAGSVLTQGGPVGIGGFPSPSPLGGFSAAALTGANPLKVLTNLSIANMVTKLVSTGMPRPKAEQTAKDLKAGKLTKDQAVQQMQAAGVPKDKAEAALADMASVAGVTVAPPKRDAPGALQLKVTLAGLNDMTGVAQSYMANEEPKGQVVAVMDHVILEPAGGDAQSSVAMETMRFLRGELSPQVVHMGEKATVKVMVGLPSAGETVVVLAKTKNGKPFQLESTEPGIFQGEIAVEKPIARGEQLVSVIAYISKESGRDSKIEEEIEKAGLWKSDQAYLFNPLYHVSKNRADLKLTVLDANPK